MKGKYTNMVKQCPVMSAIPLHAWMGEGWDGVGLIAEVTLLDQRKPDYCQTYDVTTESPAMYKAE